MSEQTKIDDGGPAFPVVETHPLMGTRVDAGLSIRDWFASQVSMEEADSIIGSCAGHGADFLGIELEKYNARIHYPIAVAKAKYIYADAMLAARKANH